MSTFVSQSGKSQRSILISIGVTLIEHGAGRDYQIFTKCVFFPRVPLYTSTPRRPLTRAPNRELFRRVPGQQRDPSLLPTYHPGQQQQFSRRGWSSPQAGDQPRGRGQRRRFVAVQVTTSAVSPLVDLAAAGEDTS